jgi:5-methylcytosine-specific restriction enzyme subunit McrC
MQGSDTTHSHNVFQIYAYVKNEDKDSTGLVEGMLLYAKTDEEIEPKLHVKTGGNKIHMNVLDLNKNFDDIKIHLNEIIKDWIGENKR